MDATIYYGGFLRKAGGAFTHVMDLRDGLQARGWHVRVVTLDDLPLWARYLPHLVERSVNLFAAPMGFYWKGRVTSALYRRRFQRAADLHVFEDIYLGWDPDGPAVTMLHALWSDNLQAFRVPEARKAKLVERERERVEGTPHPVITVSRPYATFIEDHVFEGRLRTKLHVVELGVRHAPPARVERIRGSIVYVGALEARKNVAFLLDVFARVHAQDRSRSLTIVGDGPDLGALQEKAKALGIPVRFIGRLPRPAVLEELPRHETYMHTSTKESFSYSLLEAKLAGLRTIAYAGLEVPPEFIDRPVERFDVDGWAAALLEAPKEAPPFPAARFSIERMTEETLRLARGA